MEFFTQFNLSEISRVSSLDLSFPRASFPVLYFPTMYERTRLVGDAESRSANDMPSDAAILEFPDTSASSTQGERASETAPSVAQETDNNPLEAPRASRNLNDNTLPRCHLPQVPTMILSRHWTGSGRITGLVPLFPHSAKKTTWQKTLV